MQVSIEEISSLRRKMQVEVPAEEIETEIEKRLQSMKSRVKIDGFRPGKVPLSVVRQRYGKQIHHEVIADTMQSSYRDAILQEKLRPAGAPEFEPELLEGKRDLKYNAIFDIYPEIELCDLSKAEIEVPQVEVTEADIDETLARLQKQRTEWKPTNVKSTEGHRVTIDYVGSIDGEKFAGGEGKDFQVVIGEKQMVPGFEESLVGLKENEEKQFTVSFPEDYSNKELAGKEAQFDVTVKNVEEGVLPEINEEFVKQFGLEDATLDGLKTAIRNNLEEEVNQRVKAANKQSVMDVLLEKNTVELPESLVAQEAKAVKSQTMSKMNIANADDLPDDMFAEEAKRRVKLGLLIGEITNREKMQLDQQRLQEYIQMQAAQYEDPQQVINYFKENAQARAGVEALVMEDQVTEWVMGQVQQSPKEISFSAFINPQQA